MYTVDMRLIYAVQRSLSCDGYNCNFLFNQPSLLALAYVAFPQREALEIIVTGLLQARCFFCHSVNSVKELWWL